MFTYFIIMQACFPLDYADLTCIQWQTALIMPVQCICKVELCIEERFDVIKLTYAEVIIQSVIYLFSNMKKTEMF